MRQARIKWRDHRGNPVVVRWPKEMPLGCALSSGERAELRDAVRRHPMPRRRIVLLTLVSLAMLGLLVWLCVSLPRTPLGTTIGCLASLTLLCWIHFAQSGILVKVKGVFAAAFLEIARCPSCGQELSNLVPREDDCTVCPECGAAWKVGRQLWQRSGCGNRAMSTKPSEGDPG
jgi:hypothetical protein